jgi:hypothetical protein
MKTEFLWGTIAGRILWEAVFSAVMQEGASPIPEVKQSLAKELVKERVSQKHIDNVIWPRYRPVAHLWAARKIRHDAGREQKHFPCSIAELPTFLATAEELRDKGESLRLPRSPEASILRKGDAIRLPDLVSLPGVTLHFGPAAQI